MIVGKALKLDNAVVTGRAVSYESAIVYRSGEVYSEPANPVVMRCATTRQSGVLPGCPESPWCTGIHNR